jgi:hypothetical protein
VAWIHRNMLSKMAKIKVRWATEGQIKISEPEFGYWTKEECLIVQAIMSIRSLLLVIHLNIPLLISCYYKLLTSSRVVLSILSSILPVVTMFYKLPPHRRVQKKVWHLLIQFWFCYDFKQNCFITFFFICLQVISVFCDKSPVDWRCFFTFLSIVHYHITLQNVLSDYETCPYFKLLLFLSLLFDYLSLRCFNLKLLLCLNTMPITLKLLFGGFHLCWSVRISWATIRCHLECCNKNHVNY